MILNVTNQKSKSYDTSFQVQDRQLSGVTKEYSDDSLDGNRCIKNSAISKGVQSSKNGATTIPKQAINWRSEQVNIGSITRAPPCSDEWSMHSQKIQYVPRGVPKAEKAKGDAAFSSKPPEFGCKLSKLCSACFFQARS